MQKCDVENAAGGCSNQTLANESECIDHFCSSQPHMIKTNQCAMCKKIICKECAHVGYYPSEDFELQEVTEKDRETYKRMTIDNHICFCIPCYNEREWLK